MIQRRKRMMAYVLSLALLLGMMLAVEASAAKKASLSTKKLTVLKGKSKTLTVKNTKKKVTWKILSGKKYITVKKKGKAAVTVTGRKEGRAKVQAKIGKEKLTCAVIVKNAEKESPKPAETSAPPTTTPPSASNPVNDEGTEEQDIKALKEIIKEQRERGATVSEDIYSDEYVWKNDRLIQIEWDDKNVSGELDIGGCKKLGTLRCDNGQLSSLNVTKNLDLVILQCRNNKLHSLDVTKNKKLVALTCSNIVLYAGDDYNKIEKLDVSQNVNLKYLDCHNIQLSELDVSKNVNLKELSCGQNQLTSLDISKNVNLEELDCSKNQLTNLDVSKNVNLKKLSCYWNPLTSLNLTNNTKLEKLKCDESDTVIGYDKTIERTPARG